MENQNQINDAIKMFHGAYRELCEAYSSIETAHYDMNEAEFDHQMRWDILNLLQVIRASYQETDRIWRTLKVKNDQVQADSFKEIATTILGEDRILKPRA